MKVTVEIHEVHHSIREIEVPDGSTPEQIRALAAQDAGDADELNLEYSHTLDPSCWTIRTESGEHIA
jgi:hypothetical protein